MKNISVKEISNMLKDAHSILIFPHINPDGDALGSAAALCRALRNMGKEAWVLIKDKIPEYIEFIDSEYFTNDEDCIKNQDVSICVDCSGYKRLQNIAGKYDEGKVRICLDHHDAVEGFGDYYYIDNDEAATCQIVYKVIKEMGVSIDKTVAESIYTGINTDTGSFRYSNTSVETHIIVADLMKYDIDHTEINIRLYQTIPFNRMKTQTIILERMELLLDGKVAIGYLTGDMIRKIGTTADDAEGIVEKMRNIKGVEIAVFLREMNDGIKVSMRAKSYANVLEIVSNIGGGGHSKAAGCFLNMSMDDALEIIKRKIEAYWKKYA